ncbi:hypothetical protein FA95DRAFT_1560647 [Auriscalpium vulgare]|uniref:Uncharacterized protein n=1 Tax=Auriscalpium vulgare TaxID=40419 RepID=A0ACB8RP64_9AGAM|nr:hypothetical protein FA95DRAFT_1560647 [Auriscalpium vulgare]
MTPPYREPGPKERDRYGAAGRPPFSILLLLNAPTLAKTLLWCNAAAESALVSIAWLPEGSRLRITSGAASGLLLLVFGTLLRKSAYNALGSLFTFALSLRPPGQHALVTCGPYAYVRHPSYTGAVLCALGLCMCLFSPGGLLVELGWLDTQLGRWAMGAWVGVSILATWAVVRRAAVEDAVLKERFGKEWEDWASVVRWRVCPGVW